LTFFHSFQHILCVTSDPATAECDSVLSG